jgi:hypothetical protein
MEEGGERDDDQAVSDYGSAAFAVQDPLNFWGRIWRGLTSARSCQELPTPGQGLASSSERRALPPLSVVHVIIVYATVYILSLRGKT